MATASTSTLTPTATLGPAHTPLRVGLTGGVACGKSTVAELFAARGVPVFDADQIAREVVAPGEPLLDTVFARFGMHLKRADGSLDRAALRQIVFADAAARRELEALLHPAIRTRNEVLAQAAGGAYQIHMVPLLLESEATERYDRILVVDCDETTQLQRLMTRDGIDTPQAQAMLAAQTTRRARLEAADDVIDNSGAASALDSQVATLHEKYLALASDRLRVR